MRAVPSCHIMHKPWQRSRGVLLCCTTTHRRLVASQPRHVTASKTVTHSLLACCACAYPRWINALLLRRSISASCYSARNHARCNHAALTPCRYSTSYGVIHAAEVSLMDSDLPHASGVGNASHLSWKATSSSSTPLCDDALEAARSSALPHAFVHVDQIDLFARARVVNFVRRYCRDGKAELPASAVFGVSCIDTAASLYHAYARLPLRHPSDTVDQTSAADECVVVDPARTGAPSRTDDEATQTSPTRTTALTAGTTHDGTLVYAHGVARSEKMAIAVAAMHAERIIDELGFHVYTLPSTQRRHATAARQAGRFAPMPDDETEMRPTSAHTFPLPLRHGGSSADAQDATESGAWQLVDVAPHSFVVSPDTIFACTLLDRGAQSRIESFLHSHRCSLKDCCVVVCSGSKNKADENTIGNHNDGCTYHRAGVRPVSKQEHDACTSGGYADPDIRPEHWKDDDTTNLRFHDKPCDERRKQCRSGAGSEGGGNPAGGAYYIAALTLPGVHETGGSVTARGKARTAANAVRLACMHAELLLDTLHIPLFPHHPHRQHGHARQAWSFGRPAPLPNSPRRHLPQNQLPLPLKEKPPTLSPSDKSTHPAPTPSVSSTAAAAAAANPPTSTDTASAPSFSSAWGALDESIFFARHRQLAALVTTFTDTRVCEESAVRWVRLLLRGTCRAGSPFVHERVGPYIRCTVVLPVPDVYGLCGGVGLAPTCADATALAAMHAMDELVARKVQMRPGEAAVSGRYAAARRQLLARPSDESPVAVANDTRVGDDAPRAETARAQRSELSLLPGRRLAPSGFERRITLHVEESAGLVGADCADPTHACGAAPSHANPAPNIASAASCLSAKADGVDGGGTRRAVLTRRGHRTRLSRTRRKRFVAGHRDEGHTESEEPVWTADALAYRRARANAELPAQCWSLQPDTPDGYLMVTPREEDALFARALSRRLRRMGHADSHPRRGVAAEGRSGAKDGGDARGREEEGAAPGASPFAPDLSVVERHTPVAGVTPEEDWAPAAVGSRRGGVSSARHAALCAEAAQLAPWHHRVRRAALVSARHLDHGALARLQRYLASRGRRLREAVHVRRVPNTESATGQTMFRCRLDLLLSADAPAPAEGAPHAGGHTKPTPPKATSAWGGCGEALRVKEAVVLAAMHAELTLDALGVCVCDGAVAQRRHAAACAMLGRWAPRWAGDVPPGQRGVSPPPPPPPLRREGVNSLQWARRGGRAHAEESDRPAESTEPADGGDGTRAESESASASASSVTVDGAVGGITAIRRPQIDPVSKLRVHYYLRRHGRAIARMEYHVHMTRHRVRHVAVWHMPLPPHVDWPHRHDRPDHTPPGACDAALDPSLRTVAVSGEASTKRDADTLAWMHAERTLCALGVALFDNLPGLQHWHRTQIAAAWQPLPPSSSAAHTGDQRSVASGSSAAPTPRLPGMCVLVEEDEADGPLPACPRERGYGGGEEEARVAEEDWVRYAEACAVYIDARAMRHGLRALRLSRVPRTGDALWDHTLDEVESAAPDASSVALLRAYRVVCQLEDPPDTDRMGMRDGAGKGSDGDGDSDGLLGGHGGREGGGGVWNGVWGRRHALAPRGGRETWVIRLVGPPQRRVYSARIRIPGWDGLWGEGVAEEKTVAQQRAAMHALALLRHLDGDAENRLESAREWLAAGRGGEEGAARMADEDVVVMLDEHALDPTMLIHADAARLSGGRQTCSSTSSSSSRTNPWNNRSVRMHGSTGGLSREQQTHALGADSDGIVRATSPSPSFSSKRRGVAAVVDDDVHTLTVVGKLRVLRLYAAGAVGRSAPNVTRWVTLLPGRFEVRHRTVVTLTEHNVPDRCSRDHGEEEENEEEEKEAKADRNAVGDRSTHRVEEEEEAWIARAMAAAQEGGPSDSLRRAGRQNTDEAAVAHAHNESATQERHVDDPESGDGGRGATRTHRQTKVWRGESAGCGPRQNTRRAVADLFARLRARVPAVQAWERVLRRHPLMHPDDIAHLALSHETAARLSRAMDKALSLPSPACGVIGHEALAVRNAAVWPLRQAASALTAAEPVPRHAHVDANDRDATRQNAWSKASVSCDGSPSSSSSPFSSSSLRDKAQEEQDGEGDEENDDAATWADLNDRLRRKVVNPVYVERYAAARARLSIAAHRQAILDAMAAHPVVIVCGTTGCGKTTQVPQYILDALTERNGRPLSPPHRRPHRGSIWVTQPRRLSAVSIAQRVCAERMETLTDVCGYVIRFDTRPGRHINFCTPAILLRTLYTAPLLDDINYLIIDEIHERDMNTDFLLMLLRHRILAQRPGLRVVLMSATLHAEQFSRYFGGAPIIQVEGYVHPVRELFVEDLVPFAREHRVMTPLLKEVAAATEHGDGAASTPAAPSSSAALSDTPSFCGTSRRRYDVLPSLVEIDYAAVQFAVSQARRMVDLSQSSILVFLPGWEEIMHAKSMLERDAAYHIICLHSSNAVEEQMRCFVPAAPGTIKLILSTNIAESGVTIDDVGAVVDVGCLKEKNYLANGTGWGGGASDDVSNRHSDDIYKKYKYHKYYDTAGGSNRGAHATNSTKGGGGGGGGGGNHASTAQDNLVNHISNNTFDNAEAASEEAEGWDAGVGAAQLLTVYASRANCVQRRGRAGRTRPGVCIRLYSRAHFAALHDFQTPEMLRTPLDGLCLHILALGLGAPEEVMAGALEPPSATAISAAMSRLLSLRAITANITTSRDRAGSGVPAATRSTAWSSAFGSAPRAAPEDVSPATCDSPRSALPRRSSRSRDRGGAGESDHNSDGTSCVVGSRENNAATSLCAASSSTHKLAYALTALGARLAVLPLEPRLGKVVMMGALLGCFDVALTAAVTTDSDVYTHAREQREAVRLHREEFARHTLSDAVASVNGFLFWQRCHALARAPEVVGRLEERQLHIPHLLYVSRTKRQVIEMLSQTRGLLSLGSASCAQSALSKLAASSCTTPSDALSSASTSSAKANIRQRRNVWRSIGEVCIDGSIFSRHSDDVGLLRTALCAGLLPCLAHYVAPRQLRVCACAPAKRAPHSNNDTIKSEQDAAACTHASTTMVVQTSPDSVLHKFRHPHSPEPLFLYNNLFRPRDSRHLVAHGLTAVSLWSVLITAPPTMSLAFDPVLSIGVLDGWVIFHTSREVFELVRRLGAAWAACVEHKCATPEDAEVNGVLVELGAMIRELVNTPLLRGLEPNVQYLSEHAEEPLPVRSQT